MTRAQERSSLRNAPRGLRDRHGRAGLERRVQAAREEALLWITTTPNAERIGTYLSSYENASNRALAARGRPLAVYADLLAEWGVPGIAAPVEVGPAATEMWSRSVTLAVLRCLRREGHLRAPTSAPRSGTRSRRQGRR